jgi:hypothetical protein
MKDIIGFENYQVNTNGSIFSKKMGIEIKPQDNGNGYYKVGLYKEGKCYQKYVHRLVAEAFIENLNGFKYVDHINRNKEDNRADNLRWVSAKDNTNNTAGNPRYSVSKKGKAHHSKKVVERIKLLYTVDKLGVMEISRLLDIPRQTVSRLIKDIK